MSQIINSLLDPVVNFGKVIVSTGYNNTDTVIVLAANDGAKLPNPANDGSFNLVWFNNSTYSDPADDPYVEIVRCTTRAGDVLTIVRSQEGTTVSNKNVPTKIYKMILSPTKKTITDIQTEYQSGVSTHAGIATGVHGVGVSTVESASGSQSKVDTHAALTTGIHGLSSLAPIASPTFTGTVTLPIGLTGVLRANVGVVSTDSDVLDLIDNIPYTKLADGVDGNLITWDAAGLPALVATGTSAQILTSNGAGAAPTFQDIPSVNIPVSALSNGIPIQMLTAMDESTYYGVTKYITDYVISPSIVQIYSNATPTYSIGTGFQVVRSTTVLANLTNIVIACQTKTESSTGYIAWNINGGTNTVFSTSGSTVYINISTTVSAMNEGDTLNILARISSGPSAQVYVQNLVITADPLLVGANLYSVVYVADPSILYYNKIKLLSNNNASTHAAPVQVKLYGNKDSYATALNTTKFTIEPSNPSIYLTRMGLDSITASSSSQTIWYMTVAGGMSALPNHGTILATEIGVCSVLKIEKSVLGNFSDIITLIRDTDYVIDYSTRTATKIILSSGTGIVSGQSKLRLSWISDIASIGATHNTILKVRVFLNRTTSGEASPFISPIPFGSGKYVEIEYAY
jgi:hypothetical protein